MSVDCLQPSTPPPLKRLRETLSMPTISNAKCGEIFVTSNWDKWSFNCSYCQMSTADIGVFVCHIRLQHLSAQDIPNVYETNNSSDNKQTLTCHNTQTHDTNDKDSVDTTPKDSELTTKQESLAINAENLPSSIVVNSATTCTKVSKIINLETLNETNKAEEIRDKNNKNEIQIQQTAFIDSKMDVPSNEMKQEIIQLDCDDDDNDEDVKDAVANADQYETNNSIDIANYLHCKLSDDEHNSENESIDLNEILNNYVNADKKSEDYPHKCPICNQYFKTKQGVHFHITKIHDKNLHLRLPHKCNICKKGFKTSSGLSVHKITHNKESHFKCPICSATKYQEYLFINHVLKHSSETCFPCQVCGQIFDNNTDRVTHWKTHAKDRPYSCKYCYRRYPRKQYLIQHLRTHRQYQCHFCPNIFKAAELQRQPYVCPTCKLLPDIKERVENITSLHDSSQAFESDEGDANEIIIS
ncbi:uncharacterized protein ACRADG_007465 isoform 3-T4 [Cochliomyia hominivorax]